MALSPPSGVIIEYDDGTFAPVNITQHVTEINDIDVENINEQSNPLGTSWEEHKSVGVGRMPPIEFGGFYDDAAGGPNALFAGRIPEAPDAATRTFSITYRTGKKTSVETRLISYQRSPNRGENTKYRVRLQPTGAVTET